MEIQIIDLSNPVWKKVLQAVRHDIYHLPDYVALEAKRVNAIPEALLICERQKIFFVPYLLRYCNHLFNENLTEEVFDIISPYGYSGILLSEASSRDPDFLKLAIAQMISKLKSKYICSAFLRLHPILNNQLSSVFSTKECRVTGETVSVDLRLSETEIWQQTRPEHRNKINRCKRSGMTARIVSLSSYIDEFISIYDETMERVGADNSYYFGYDYFADLANLGERLHLCLVELNEKIICAGLFTECCGIVQYHLGGTRTQFLKQAPSKFMFDFVRFWAKERGNEFFHLGGGVGAAKDSLYHFKAGFSKQRHPFLTLRIVIDEAQYFSLVKLRAKALNTEVKRLAELSFFPTYRLSSIETN